MSALRNLAILSVPAVAAAAGAALSSGCGGQTCCLAVCVGVVRVHITAPGGVLTTAFGGTYTLPGETPVAFQCPDNASPDWSCGGSTLAIYETPPALTLAIVSTATSAHFDGEVDPSYEEETVCCSTCDVGDVDLELVPD